jgi:hypothetical protein
VPTPRVPTRRDADSQLPSRTVQHASKPSHIRGSPSFQIRCRSSRPTGRRAINITENLHSALQNLRRPDKTHVLWVDAVCIYRDRYRSKCCRNLTFEPQFCEGVGFAHWSLLPSAIISFDFDAVPVFDQTSMGRRSPNPPS